VVIDPYQPYATAVAKGLPAARLVVDHFIRLANAALDEVRRRTQNDTLGHRGRKADPLYRIRRRLLAGPTGCSGLGGSAGARSVWTRARDESWLVPSSHLRPTRQEMDMTDTELAAIPQGSPQLLDTPLAQRLLAAAIPARVAYVAKDGTPRISASWFQWTDGELVMPTFIQAPHVAAPARRLAALRARPDVAVSIDTESGPAQVLMLRGKAQVTEVDGIDPDYASSARQYLGEQAANQYLAMVDQPGTRMARITVRPSWVGLLDFAGNRLPGVMTPPDT
jgi:Transposase/Pyridoxamine 5'-phosphate oxidase